MLSDTSVNGASARAQMQPRRADVFLYAMMSGVKDAAVNDPVCLAYPLIPYGPQRAASRQSSHGGDHTRTQDT
jgi:hypothetical protein